MTGNTVSSEVDRSVCHRILQCHHQQQQQRGVKLFSSVNPRLLLHSDNVNIPLLVNINSVNTSRCQHCSFNLCFVVIFLLLFGVSDVTARGRYELSISPHENAQNEVTRAVGSAVVFKCELIVHYSHSLEGQRIDLTPDNTQLDWYDKNDAKIPQQDPTRSLGLYAERISPTISKLYITRTHNKHAGLYTCVHAEGNRRVQEKTVTLLLYRDIEFEVAHSAVHAALGGTVLLPCRVHAKPTPSISWRHGSHKIKSEGRYEQLSDGLLVTNITAADQGAYHCQALVESSGLFKEIKIDLKLQAAPTYADERVLMFSGTEGESLSIWCNATGSPPINYEFFKDGEPLRPEGGHVSLEVESGVLTFITLNSTDEGRYLCMASNVVGRVTAERVVKVHSAPVIYELKSIIESRGMTATLLCKSTGRPPPVLTFRRLAAGNQHDVINDVTTSVVYAENWRYEGGRIQVHQVIPGCAELIISHVTVADAGAYRCDSQNAISNDSRNATIEVGYQPHFIVNSPRLLFSWPGRRNKHNLTCSVDSLPDSAITWSHNSVPLDHNNETFHVFTVNSSSSILQVSMQAATNDVTTDESDFDWIYGLYTCQAVNYFGYNLLHLELHKAEVPGEPMSVSVVKSLTTSVHLEVEAPAFTGGLPVKGFIVRNELQETFFHVGEEIWLNGLRPSTIYLLTVSAVNDVGVGTPVQFDVTTDDLQGPSPVENISIKPLKSTECVVTWRQPYDGGMPIRLYQLRYRRVSIVQSHSKVANNAVLNGDGYYYSWIPASNWSNVSIRVNYSSRFSAAATDDDDVVVSYQLSKLVSHSYYELQIRALNDLDWSPLSPNNTPYYFNSDTARSSANSHQVFDEPLRMTMVRSSQPSTYHILMTSPVMTSLITSLMLCRTRHHMTVSVLLLFLLLMFFNRCCHFYFRVT